MNNLGYHVDTLEYPTETLQLRNCDFNSTPIIRLSRNFSE